MRRRGHVHDARDDGLRDLSVRDDRLRETVHHRRRTVRPAQYCSNGTCKVKKALGTGCAATSECSSGFCSPDLVCCDKACTGACTACLKASTGQTDGTCAPVQLGQDPHNDCAMEAGSTCGKDGACDGKGGCHLYAAGPRAVPGPAPARRSPRARSATERGCARRPEPPMDCGQNACTTGGCSTTCKADTDCTVLRLLRQDDQQVHRQEEQRRRLRSRKRMHQRRLRGWRLLQHRLHRQVRGVLVGEDRGRERNLQLRQVRGRCPIRSATPRTHPPAGRTGSATGRDSAKSGRTERCAARRPARSGSFFGRPHLQPGQVRHRRPDLLQRRCLRHHLGLPHHLLGGDRLHRKHLLRLWNEAMHAAQGQRRLVRHRRQAMHERALRGRRLLQRQVRRPVPVLLDRNVLQHEDGADALRRIGHLRGLLRRDQRQLRVPGHRHGLLSGDLQGFQDRPAAGTCNGSGTCPAATSESCTFVCISGTGVCGGSCNPGDLRCGTTGAREQCSSGGQYKANACPSGQVCSGAGSCGCASGTTTCPGATGCFDTNSDKSHCGASCNSCGTGDTSLLRGKCVECTSDANCCGGQDSAPRRTTANARADKRTAMERARATWFRVAEP